MWCFLDKFFRCREIILSTNIEYLDGFNKELHEWDEYLKYYDQYINQDAGGNKDYHSNITEFYIDYENSDIEKVPSFYLTDNIIKISDDGNHVLLDRGEYNEWLMLSEFDSLLEKNVKKRIEKFRKVKEPEKHDHKEIIKKGPSTLDELLMYFDQLESDKYLKVFREEDEENHSTIIDESAGDIIDDIMTGLGLTKSFV